MAKHKTKHGNNKTHGHAQERVHKGSLVKSKTPKHKTATGITARSASITGLTACTLTIITMLAGNLVNEHVVMGDDTQSTTNITRTTSVNGPSRSSGREVLPQSDNDDDTKSINTVDGSWGLETMNVPYSKSPLEKATDIMASQSKADLERLAKAKHSSNGNGWATNIVNNNLTLTKETMDELRKAYKASEPTGFDPDHATGDSGNAYSFSQCTWWTYVRRHQLGLPAGSYMGDGRMWADTARRLGYWVDNEPMVGDVIVFQPGQAGADGYYGHVGVVENVIESEGEKYVVTSESSAEYNGSHFSRILPNPESYEYIHY